jgi:hypothetical protein
MLTTETLAREAWRGYQCNTFPEGSWVSEGDMLRTVAEAARIDLITRRQYRHFALELEWRVASGGNSGVIYRVSEAPCRTPGRAVWKCNCSTMPTIRMVRYRRPPPGRSMD